ncbi:hypothetical protein GCM10009840_21060 [Pseudolysinimonas kribbensis]|uniref:YggT family protein n=1 Tax=Pseudolysinimonas kribbensis TaxID=433641 RepID=A0ABQ6KAE8_9MICO|nr:hypothetical protein [Pseudolysinimonas kribbensis]GMA93291.1 hypothetical protein GCM10025881_01150 [Pseudolysinimonas kribbensis]GMA97193.1 hypothetical protein GCM10025881_40170 [Pseudolysinimonas kribbensis]
MIVQWLIDVATGFAAWFASLFPVWEPPEWLVHLDDQVNPVLDNLAGVGAWVDWTFILAVVSAVLLCWGITLSIKVLRAVASYLPFIGGAG